MSKRKQRIAAWVLTGFTGAICDFMFNANAKRETLETKLKRELVSRGFYNPVFLTEVEQHGGRAMWFQTDEGVVIATSVLKQPA